ncbi:MAG: hypothetical protein Q9163_005358 [Psora crenata]
MNASQSIFSLPSTLSNSDGPECIQTSSGGNSKKHDTGRIRTPPSATLTNTTASTSAKTSDIDLDLGLSDATNRVPWSSHPLRERQPVCESTSATGTKRASSRISPHLHAATDPPPTKKLHRRRRSQSELDSPASSQPDDLYQDERDGPGFISHLRQERPPLPHRFSSSEAGPRMLNKTNKEETGRPPTIQLARVSMNQSGPSRPLAVRTPSGGGRNHVTLGGKSKAPSDGSPRTPGPSLLHQISITEVLDQDERPTFILDVADQTNFEPGPLKIIYTNVSLKTATGMLDQISGVATQASPALTATTAFSDFKGWAMSYVKDHESLDIPLPSFTFAGAQWSCSPLRKRLRLFRGYPNSTPMSFTPNAAPMGYPLTLPVAKENEMKTGPAESVKEGPQDYFGSVVISSAKHSRTNTVRNTGQETGPAYQPTETGFSLAARDESLQSDSTSRLTSSSRMRTDKATLRAASAGSIDRFSLSSQPVRGFFDWTRLPNVPSLPRHIQFAKSIDWASTPLGPMEKWSAELRSMCNLVMASPHPAAMYWGEDHIAIYNEAYVLLAGSKHPELMGQSYRVAWTEIWDGVKGFFEHATKTGQATMKDDDCLFISRSAGENLEETYFSWSIIPLVGSDGSVVGLYNPAFEKTRRKVAERRMFTLRELGERTATARDLKTFWAEVLEALEGNEWDAPFVLLYSIAKDMDNDSHSSTRSKIGGSRQCILEGSIGIPDGHPAAAPQIDLRNGTEYFGQVFREAIKNDRPVYLSVQDGTLDSKLLEGIQWRGFGDRCTAAVCCPVHSTGGESTLGFLVMGINPRRPYDDDYSLFVQLLSRQLATTMASVVLFEEEIARGRRAATLAAKEQVELSEQLKATAQQAEESEIRFTRMAELAPVGMFVADSTGKITYCNDKWYEISKVPKDSLGSDLWMDAVMSEDKERLLRLWADLVDNAVSLDTEIRFKTSWEDENGNKGDTWVLASAFPDQNPDGSLRMIFGSITDISQQKWAEHFEKRRMEEAVEMKRQQENFIDITSHEMRNPLSAMLQCADEIHTSLTDLKESKISQAALQEVMKNAIEASSTITLCAQHQKRIVDDILTMSKMDSALLLVTPCPTEPKSIVQRALRMFESELQSNDIKMNFHADESLEKLGIEWVTMDPSRVLQVLINLTTNSIKFTSTQQKRVITVTIGASLERLSSNGIVPFVPSRSKQEDLTENTHEWGTGEQVYIHFAVEDTGRGLTDDEKRILFLRFSQASPRTHITYGGSGLGLFISRELVELQGGEIGVASTAGEGSTFAFYVKARRSTAPADGADQFSGFGQRKDSARKHASHLPSGDSPSESTGTALAQRSVSKENLKILIVEDNLVNQKVLARQLRNIGCVVHVANHGGECLDRLQQSTFARANKGSKDAIDIDVVLMDQEMPVMDGLACTREIRELEKKGEVIAHVPIIGVTANARNEQIDAAKGAGMDDVVSKPFRILELIPKVGELIDLFPNPAK